MSRAISVFASFALAACASAPGYDSAGDRRGGANSSVRISQGMQRLGASEARGSCFGDRVAETLEDDGRDEAALVVEGANNRDEMRDKVLNASRPVRKAFIGASMRCALVD